MNYEQIIKKQSVIILCSVLVMVFVIIGTSYAFFMKVDESNTQTVESGTLTIQFATSDSAISTAVVPQSDYEALHGIAYIDGVETYTKDYTFSVTNNGTLYALYNIYMYADSSISNNIPIDYIKYAISDGDKLLDGQVYKLSDVVDKVTEDGVTKYILLKDKLIVPNNKDYDTYNIKVWIDEDSPTSIIGNSFSFKLEVYGEVDEEELEFTIDDTNYKFLANMTWFDYINSDYNTLGLVKDDDGYIVSDGKYIKLDSENVSYSDVILNGVYTLE